MTLNFPQDPCQDIDNSYRDNNTFKRSVLRILCKLVPDAAVLLGKVGLVDSAGADITATNPLPVSATVIPIAGAATSANQVLEIAELTSIDGKITTCDTGNVTISSMPPVVLPVGSATAANQVLEIAKLTSIDGKITTCNTSSIAGSVAVTNAAGASAVNIQDGGNSITVDGTVAVSSIPSISGSVTVSNAAGASAVNIQDGGNSITVDGSVNAAVTGSVSVTNAAGASAVNIQDGGNSITVDGAVSVNNAAGASAVNIQDGGNSITVDGSVGVTGSVTVSNAAGASAVNIQDGGNSITVDGSISISSSALPSGAATAANQTTQITSLNAINSKFSNDAFGRLRVSFPSPLFDNMAEYGENTFLWESATASGGTVTSVANNCAVRLSTAGTGSGASAIRQTKQYTRYQPGRSLNIETTFVMSAAQTNARTRIGYFDANNGIFLERTGSTINIVRRTFVTGVAVDNAVAQASWNVDPLNGSGPSGLTIDLTKTQILFIQLQFLGVGRVQVGFVLNGVLYVAHEFLNTNSLSTVYMSTGCLPLRGEVVNTGVAGGTITIDMFCSSISSGGIGLNKLIYSQSTGTSLLSTNTTLKPLISIRAATLLGGTGGGGSITNRGHINPTSFSVMVASQAHEYQFILNPTLTGPSWTAVGSLSITDYDVSATVISGGTLLDVAHVSSGSATRVVASESLDLTFPLVYSGLNSVQDILTLAVRTVTGNGSASGSISWQEEF